MGLLETVVERVGFAETVVVRVAVVEAVVVRDVARLRVVRRMVRVGSGSWNCIFDGMVGYRGVVMRWFEILKGVSLEFLNVFNEMV